MAMRILLAAAVGLSVPAAFADDIPKLDPAPSCRAAAEASVEDRGRFDKCLAQEQRARDQIAKEWAQFNEEEKQSCTRLSAIGYKPTYTVLLTCLETARAVRNLPARDRTPETVGIER